MKIITLNVLSFHTVLVHLFLVIHYLNVYIYISQYILYSKNRTQLRRVFLSSFIEIFLVIVLEVIFILFVLFSFAHRYFDVTLIDIRRILFFS